MFFQLYLIFEELLVRAILKLQLDKACLLTLKVRGTPGLWLNAFLPFPKWDGYVCTTPPCAPCRLQPVMRCWLVQATAQQGTWHWLSSPDWFVAVLETPPWLCVWFHGHCGKKPQKAVLSLKSRTLKVKLKDVSPKLPLTVNQHCSKEQGWPWNLPPKDNKMLLKYNITGDKKDLMIPPRLGEAYKSSSDFQSTLWKEVYPTEPSFTSLYTHSLASMEINRKFKSKIDWFNLAISVEKEKMVSGKKRDSQKEKQEKLSSEAKHQWFTYN